tara:strand:- start:306 stop:536 length:231 start_codon:yes stop_codon:yes gene_type:complete
VLISKFGSNDRRVSKDCADARQCSISCGQIAAWCVLKKGGLIGFGRYVSDSKGYSYNCQRRRPKLKAQTDQIEYLP